MAFTVSTLVQTLLAKERMTIYRVTADATTGSFDTGYNVVSHASYMIEKMASAPTTNFPVIAFNAGVSATAINGTIAMTNTVSADIYHVMVLSPS